MHSNITTLSHLEQLVQLGPDDSSPRPLCDSGQDTSFLLLGANDIVVGALRSTFTSTSCLPQADLPPWSKQPGMVTLLVYNPLIDSLKDVPI